MSKENTSLQEVNLKTLGKSLSSFYEHGIPLYLWGRPSTAKTSKIREFAKAQAAKMGLQYSEDKYGADIFTLKVITLSQYDSPDLRGMPEIVGTANRVTEFVPTVELPRVGQGIIFFDEMNLADAQTRAACYQYILEGRYGSLPAVLDKNGKESFWRCAASNTENDFSNVNDSSLALLRRFSHMSIQPDVEEVTDYYAALGLDPRIVSYIKSHPEDLFPQKWDEKLLDNKANPFPSTWENAAKMVESIHPERKSGADAKEAENNMFALVASCVGAPLASKFSSFCTLIGQIDEGEFVRNPKKEIAKMMAHEEKSSLMYAATYALSYKWKKRMNYEHGGKAHKVKGEDIVNIANELSPEFSTSFMIACMTSRSTEITNAPGAKDVLLKIGKYFDYGS